MIKAQNLSAGHADTRRDNMDVKPIKMHQGIWALTVKLRVVCYWSFFWKPQAKDKLLGKAEKGAEFWKVGPGKGSDKHQQQEAVPVSDWTHHSKKNQLKLTICLRIQKNRDQSPVGMVGIEKNDPNWHHLLLSQLSAASGPLKRGLSGSLWEFDRISMVCGTLW